MKTRLQLAKGYVTGTLSIEERQIAERNTVIISEINRLMEPIQSIESKTVEHKQGKRGTHVRPETL